MQTLIERQRAAFLIVGKVAVINGTIQIYFIPGFSEQVIYNGFDSSTEPHTQIYTAECLAEDIRDNSISIGATLTYSDSAIQYTMKINDIVPTLINIVKLKLTLVSWSYV